MQKTDKNKLTKAVDFNFTNQFSTLGWFMYLVSYLQFMTKSHCVIFQECM